MAYIIHLYIYYTLHKKLFVYKNIVFKLMSFAGLASWHAVLLFDMFSPHECPQCKRSNVEPGWPCDAVLCLDCCVLCIFRRLYQLHRKRRLPFVIAHLIDQFCFDYVFWYSKSPKLWFLQCVLLSNGSVFRTFTFYWGGRLGNISETEDIIDGILSYL